MIQLDGSLGEGGGQILRTALALSLITQQPFRLENIRAKRSKPGLMRQHLACVQAAVSVCGGDAGTALQADGAPVQVGSMSLCFEPKAVRSSAYEFKVGSAGSSMLVLQTVLWPLACASSVTGTSTLRLHGGTHNPMAPSLSFLEHFAQILCRRDAENAQNSEPILHLELRRHGFYPAGGGEVLARIDPAPQGLMPMQLMGRGALLDASAVCLHAGIPRGVAERELAALRQALNWGEDQLHNRPLRANEGPGNALMLRLRYEHITELFASYGDKGVSAEQVASNLAKEVRAYMINSAPVGPHMADQLMIPLALNALKGISGEYVTTELTEHTRTNALVIERFLPVKFEMMAKDGGFVISVKA